MKVPVKYPYKYNKHKELAYGEYVRKTERSDGLGSTVSQDSSDTIQLVLLSANSFLQTELLAKLIADEIGGVCNIAKSANDIDKVNDLILIDCAGHGVEQLSHVVNQLHTKVGEIPSALINAEYDSEHEGLLEWPSIFGIFYKDTDQAQLIRGLKCLLEGDYWVPRKLLHHFLDKNRRAPTGALNKLNISLTKREQQILRLIKEGATNAAISDVLEVSEHTVKSHLYNVYKKIGVKNRLEASNWVRDIEGL